MEYIRYGVEGWKRLRKKFINLYGKKCLRNIYKDAVENYNPEKYRILCHNCNFCIGMHGSCLHKNNKLKTKHSKLVTSSEFGNSRYYNYNLRVKFLDMYGRKCAICNQSGNVFLTLDHIQNDGNKDRKETGDGWNAYRKAIKKLNLNKYRTLCCNCNFSRKRS